MAGADGMMIQEVVKDVMVREHSDMLRAAVEAVCAELMEMHRAALLPVAVRRPVIEPGS
jgi:hypothetical protein